MGDESMKTCCKCRLVMSAADEFYRDSRRKDGRAPWCKVCSNTATRRTQRARELRRYGISEDQYDQRLTEQLGLCAICGEGCRSGGRLSVDHDHKTGEVRGLLCKQCNLAIGLLGDDPQRVDAAATYLRTTHTTNR